MYRQLGRTLFCALVAAVVVAVVNRLGGVDWVAGAVMGLGAIAWAMLEMALKSTFAR